MRKSFFTLFGHTAWLSDPLNQNCFSSRVVCSSFCFATEVSERAVVRHLQGVGRAFVSQRGHLRRWRHRRSCGERMGGGYLSGLHSYISGDEGLDDEEELTY